MREKDEDEEEIECDGCALAGWPPATATVETPYWGTIHVCAKCKADYDLENLEESNEPGREN